MQQRHYVAALLRDFVGFSNVCFIPPAALVWNLRVIAVSCIHGASISVVSWSTRWVYFVRPDRPKFLTYEAAMDEGEDVNSINRNRVGYIVGPMCCVTRVKEPSALIEKRRGLPRCSWFDWQHHALQHLVNHYMVLCKGVGLILPIIMKKILSALRRQSDVIKRYIRTQYHHIKHTRAQAHTVMVVNS